MNQPTRCDGVTFEALYQWTQILLDGLHGFGIEASGTAYATGTVQLTLKGDPAVVREAISACMDGVAAAHGWDQDEGET
jgi:hypothetical protein